MSPTKHSATFVSQLASHTCGSAALCGYSETHLRLPDVTILGGGQVGMAEGRGDAYVCGVQVGRYKSVSS